MTHQASPHSSATRPPKTDGTSQERLTRISFDMRSVWRATWVVIGCLALVWLISFFAGTAGGALFQICLALFIAMAMEPAVSRLARRIPRGLATAIVMLVVAAGMALFFMAFGGLLMSEIQSLLTAAPGVVTDVVSWANHKFDTDYDINTLLSKIQLTPERVAGYASQLAGGVLGIVNSVASTLFGAFVLAFFTFYFSASMPRLRNWIAGLFPQRQQGVVLTVWEVLLTKVGGYVSARFILATISATCHTIFMMLIGMPYYLALGLWTGLVAQFIPNIGTYISIALPVVVGLTSNDPRDGLYVLIFAIVYQQIENITIEPNISARAVDVHPAVSFASALIGVKMFGLAGGVLGVPVAATFVAIIELYKRRYEVLPDTHAEARERADGKSQRKKKAKKSGSDGPAVSDGPALSNGSASSDGEADESASSGSRAVDSGDTGSRD